MVEEKLWNIHQLLEHYPALKMWGVRWLIRNRRIPMVRVGTRRIFFDPADIEKWINSQKLEPIQGYDRDRTLKGRNDGNSK